MLKLTDLYKSYGSTTVLKGISLEVKTGDVVCIIGPSGSGKSTLLRCINRLEEPDSGSITMAGLELTSPQTNIAKARRDIGMVFQGFNLYPHMTALQNVSLALRFVLKASKKEAQERGEEALRQVGLGDKMQSFPSQLSGGQQQRVGIARAMVMRPKIMLFDEPTSALDPELVGEVLSVMRDLSTEGITMVVVSHEMGFAQDVANEIVFMEGGHIVEQGEPAVIFKAPKMERTAQFLSRIKG